MSAVDEARAALLDKLTPHAQEGADDARRKAAIGRRLAMREDLDALIAAVRAETLRLMEEEGVVTWGDNGHRERFLAALEQKP